MIWNICNVLASMGPSTIDLYEWKRADVLKARLENNPLWSRLATPVGVIPLTGIRLAHAVVKADYLIKRNYALPSLGFLLQMDQIIDFGSSTNLKLLPGASSTLADATQSSLAGRVGQGLSILFFAETRGYNFLGHLGSDPTVLAHLAAIAERPLHSEPSVWPDVQADTDDLFFRKLLPLHLSVPSKGRSLGPTG